MLTCVSMLCKGGDDIGATDHAFLVGARLCYLFCVRAPLSVNIR